MRHSLEALKKATSSECVSAARGSVMVVDDSPGNLMMMEEILRPRGYQVSSFPRGRMALKAAAEAPPDLILLDITMPEMNGYEMCELLKADERLSEIPVIFLSGLNELEDRLRAFRSGAVDYVCKPFQIEEIEARVDTHVRLRRLQQEIEADNEQLEKQVQAQVTRVADAQMAMIFALAKLAAARDDETGRHLDRIQTFSGLLAIAMSDYEKYRNLAGSSWITNIFHASPLHDIGKVAIPDRILRKPGPLTPEEFEIMKTHAPIGAETLRTVHMRYPDSEFIGMGIDIAQSHHERWDGAGYPEGLAGEAIPVCARIVAVADCYDALRSKRCYKRAYAHEEACTVILEGSGSQFDPDVAAAFGAISATWRDVWNRMNDDGEQGSGPFWESAA